MRRKKCVWQFHKWIVCSEWFRIVDIQNRTGFRICLKKKRKCFSLQNYPSTCIDHNHIRSHQSDHWSSDEITIRWSAVDMNRKNVRFTKERFSIDAHRAAGMRWLDIQQIIEEHAKTNRLRNFSKATSHAATSKNSQSEFAHLATCNNLAACMLPLIKRQSMIEKNPRAKGISQKANDIFNDGLRVRIWSVNHRHTSRCARIKIDVVNANTSSSHNLQIGQAIQERSVDIGIGSHHQTRRILGVRGKGLASATALNDPRNALQPSHWGLRKGFTD